MTYYRNAKNSYWCASGLIAVSMVVLMFFICPVQGQMGGFGAFGRPASQAATGPSVVMRQSGPLAVHPGDKAVIALEIVVPEGYWLYSPAPRGELVKPIPLSVRLVGTDEVSDTETLYPEPIWHTSVFSSSTSEAPSDALDETSGEHNLVYEGSLAVYVPVEISADVQAGMVVLDAELKGQLCDKLGCYPVRAASSVELGVLQADNVVAASTVPLKIPEGYMSTAQMDAALPHFPGDQTSGNVSQVQTVPGADMSTIVALLVALLAGITLNFMPCVLPVIPIKILSIIQQAGDSNRRRVFLGMSYALGILSFFIVIGVISAFVRIAGRGVFNLNEPFKSPAFIISMIMLMSAAAAWLFGAFTIGIGGVSGGSGRSGGFFGSLGMGFFTALLATPCSGPVLAAVFGWAQSRGAGSAVLVFISLGAGMASPHALLAAMPKLLDKLPKPGVWMERIKQSMGFVLLGVAIWMLSVLGDPAWIFRVGLLAVILTGCLWLGWTVVNLTTTPLRRKVTRAVAVIVFALAAVVLAGRPSESAINWRSFDSTAIASAKGSGNVVLVKYSAQWCTLCRIVDMKVYHNESVVEILGEGSKVRSFLADVTWDASPAEIELSEKLGEPGPPLTIIYGPALQEPIRFRGVFSVKDLIGAITMASGGGGQGVKE